MTFLRLRHSLLWMALLPFLGLSQSDFQLPSGFAAELIQDNLNPVKMVIGHHGEVWVVEKHGQVWVVEDGEWPDEPFIALEVDDWNERGLLGIALHPDFDNLPYVYLYYTVAGANHNRLSRFTANGGFAVPGSEVILMEFDDLEGTIHNGGAIIFGTDDLLYVATGDGANADNGQDLSTLSGKIIRLLPNGNIPLGNPYYQDLEGDLRSIYALGIRNPFSMAQDPITEQLFFCDVGASTWEEVNVVTVGGNFGWKDIEGPLNGQNPPDNYQEPLHAYSHDNGCAVVGAAFYRPELASFPAEYHGNFFFADYCEGEVRRLDPSSGEQLPVFITGMERPLALEVAPASGDLYILGRAGLGGGSMEDNTSTNDGTLWRIFYTGSGAPIVSADPQDVLVPVGESARFEILAFGDQPLQYQWQQDGADIANSNNPILEMPAVSLEDDQSQFRCIVSNAEGADTSLAAILSVTDNMRPQPVIALPIAATSFRAGDTINYAGSATDPEDGALPPSALTWTIDWHHDQHTHPVITPTSGMTGGEIIIPIVNETDPDVWLRFYLSATDSEGLEQTVYTEIYPELAVINLIGNPEVGINVDGQVRHPPNSFESLIGIQRTLEAPQTIITEDSLFFFTAWSTGETERLISFQTPEAGLDIGAEYTGIALGEGTGLIGDYYDDPQLDFSGELELTRIDSVVAFQWAGDSPEPGLLPADFFTVRWTGEIQSLTEGTYNFCIRSDDGVRLWIDDQLIINQWVPQGPTEHCAEIELAANQRYPIRLEYHEIGGGAEVFFFWETGLIDKRIVPKRQLYPFVNRSSVGGNVWLDENLNNFRDITEEALPGIRVELFESTGGDLIEAQLTDSEGNYHFPFLPDGIYYLRFLHEETGLDIQPGTGLNPMGETPLFELAPQEERVLHVSFYPASTDASELPVALLTLSMYPNPTQGDLLLSWGGTARPILSLQLSHPSGQILKEWRWENLQPGDQLPIDLSMLPAGAYNFRIQSGNEVFYQRIQKL